MDKIVSEIKELKDKYDNMKENPDAKVIDRKKFTLLLSGVSTFRKVPGIAGHMGYDELYHCEGEENIAQVKEHLQKMFGVTDKESLLAACRKIYSGCNEYEQFMTFWCDAPLFELEQLNEDGRKGFLQCKNLAEKFYPIVKERGFYAWDINERITMCRTAVACGIVSDDEFWEITDMWVRQAQVFYQSFGEYAISCLCGAVYAMGKYYPDTSQFFNLNCNIIENLMSPEGEWYRNGWYFPKEREWAVLIGNNPGCVVMKRAIEMGDIGYMYREEPRKDFPDSGWRFFVGDESDEYANNPENCQICGLNTIVNICPDIMAYLNAKTGRKFGRNSQGWEEE